MLDALLMATYEHFGRLDIVINNASTSPVTAGPSDHGGPPEAAASRR
ncbi:MAG: hypothetical protein IPP88_09540 [Betaproteobacteria bacterium]|nr:hypothetical protein [Betaproteobacteria bacterium]